MRITSIRINIVAGAKVKAYVSIILDNCFVISGIKIIDLHGGLFVAMPSKQKKDKSFQDLAHPLNCETRELIENAILDKYERMLEKLY